MAQTSKANFRSGLPVPNSSASFWHSEPSPLLLNHRTTDSLPRSADIVVIGSGITGASCARYLASDPRTSTSSVLMLEAREACWGATGRNGGHCHPLLYERPPAVAAFELRNVAEVKRYIEENRVDCEWRQVVGCRTFWDEKLWEATVAEIEELQANEPDVGNLVKVTVEKKVLEEYRVASGVVGATLTEGAGQLWPYKYVTFMLEKLVKEGKLNLQTNTPVISIEPGNSTDGKYKVTLITPRGTVKAQHVILATNGYTSHLLESFTPLIVPVRCEMSALIPPKDSSRLPASYGFVGAHQQNPNYDDYLIQRPFYEDVNGLLKGGHLMFGGGRGMATDPCVGVWEDDIIDQGEATYLRRGLLDTLKLGGDDNVEELRASHQWTGIKGYSRDNMPWVGKIPGTSGVWLAGGYTGHGMPNATLCGRAVVEMVSGIMDGRDLRGIETDLVAGGWLPECYLISDERIEKAMGLPTVEVQDVHGLLGDQSVEMLAESGKKGEGGARVGMATGEAKAAKEGKCMLM